MVVKEASGVTWPATQCRTKHKLVNECLICGVGKGLIKQNDTHIKTQQVWGPIGINLFIHSFDTYRARKYYFYWHRNSACDRWIISLISDKTSDKICSGYSEGREGIAPSSALRVSSGSYRWGWAQPPHCPFLFPLLFCLFVVCSFSHATASGSGCSLSP